MRFLVGQLPSLGMTVPFTSFPAQRSDPERPMFGKK